MDVAKANLYGKRLSEEEDCAYVLMSAAHNEEKTIELTIKSILDQVVRPSRWVIVSDNSTDHTDAIIQQYAEKCNFIRFVRVAREPGRNFASKVLALQKGAPALNGASYQFIGNIDSDISIDPNYFPELINRFKQNERLGIAGGFVYEKANGEFQSRPTNSAQSVAHAAQLVRRECYEAIGGYAVLKYGGEDWHAQVSARMRGWEAEAFPELKILHHRKTGGHGSLVRNAIREGRADYSLGSYLPFEVMKCLSRWRESPLIVGAALRLGSFAASYLSGEQKAVSEEFASFLREEQKRRILSLFKPVAAAGRQRHLPED